MYSVEYKGVEKKRLSGLKKYMRCKKIEGKKNWNEKKVCIEKKINKMGMMYINQMSRANIAVITLKIYFKNVFITVSSLDGKVYRHYSFTKLYRKKNEKLWITKKLYNEVGEKIMVYLKKLKVLGVMLCVRDIELWRYRGIVKRIKKEKKVKFMGRITFPIIHVGSRRKKRYKRKKKTRKHR